LDNHTSYPKAKYSVKVTYLSQGTKIVWYENVYDVTGPTKGYFRLEQENCEIWIPLNNVASVEIVHLSPTTAREEP